MKEIKITMNTVGALLSLATAMVGYTIHHSVFWSIGDFIFAPLAWCKWLVCHEVSVSVVKHTFSFLAS